MTDESLLAEQISYYRERAPEYDRWWYRTHQYALPDDKKALWDESVAACEAWLRSLEPFGETLELACGTGLFTRHLVDAADGVVAVDASPEVIAINRGRLPGRGVQYVEADVFAYEPAPAAYDTVFFSFWLSHVPPARAPAFWAMVRRALRPGGRAVFLDNVWDDRLWHHGSRPTDTVQRRTDLSSGRAYRVVKVYYEPSDLEAQLGDLGWDADVTTAGVALLVGTATPR